MRSNAPSISSKVIREGVVVAIGQVSVVLGALAGVRCLTSAMTASVYGELMLGITVATFANQILTGPIAGSALRFYSASSELHQVSEYTSAITKILSRLMWPWLLLGVVVLSLCALIYDKHVALLAGTATVYAAAAGANGVFNSMHNAARRRVYVSVHQVAECWGRFGLALLLVTLFGKFSWVAMAGFAIASVVVAISQFMRIKRGAVVAESNLERLKPWVNRLLEYAWPFSLWGIFGWGQLASDRWALALYGSTTDVAQYSVLYQLGFVPVSLASALVVQVLAPIVFEKAGDSTDPHRMRSVHVATRRIFIVTVLAGLAAFGVAYAFDDKIMSLCAAAEYGVVAPLLPWMVLAGGIYAVGQSLSLALMSENNTRGMIAPKLGPAIIGIVANIAGARWFGIAGVVGASLIYAISHYAWLQVVQWSSMRRRTLPVASAVGA